MAQQTPPFVSSHAHRLRTLLLAGCLFCCGLVPRLLVLPRPGTNDVGCWESWSYATVTYGVSSVYELVDPAQGSFTAANLVSALRGKLNLRAFHYQRHTYRADYPPVAVYLLWAVGELYRATHSEFLETTRLQAAIKSLTVIADLGLTSLLYWGVSRLRGRRDGIVAAAGFWLNPAFILMGSSLGYLDMVYALPLVFGVLAGLNGAVTMLWVGFAVACAVKPQPIFLLPAMIAVSCRYGRGQLVRGAVAAAAVWGVLALPVMFSGNTVGLISAVSTNANDHYVSAFAPNVWWLALSAVLWWHHRLPTALNPHVPSVDFVINPSQLMPLFHLHFDWLRMTGAALWLGLSLILIMAMLRRRKMGMNTFAGDVLLFALQFFTATMVLASMHENHLLGDLPLFLLAAALADANCPIPRRVLWAIYWALSLIVAVNTAAHFGVGGQLKVAAIDTPATFAVTGVAAALSIVIYLYAVCRFVRNSRKLTAG